MNVGKGFYDKAVEAVLVGKEVGAGLALCPEGGVFLSVRDSDKGEVAEVARRFAGEGFMLYATQGTAAVLQEAGLDVKKVEKMHEHTEHNVQHLFDQGKIDYILSTSTHGRDPHRDSVIMRRRAVALGIPTLTSMDTARALTEAIATGFAEKDTALVDLQTVDGPATR